MSRDDDPDVAMDPRVLESSSDEILRTLESVSAGAEAKALGDMDRIRRAFRSSEAEFRAAQKDAQRPGPDPSPEPSFPGYRVIENLGSGGFGAVYRARDERLGRDIALKVLHPFMGGQRDAALRFLQEARALAKVRHPNVLAIHAVLEKDGAIALAMELIEGRGLDKLVASDGPLSAAEAARMGAEVCRALAAVHAAGIVHRDVKPANVLREKGGRIVLADFGLGVFMDPEEGSAGPDVAGSPLFMAPEQASGDPVDRRTDLYAAGVLLYFLSTGRYPVPLGSLGEVLGRVRSGNLIPIRDARPDLPEAFARVVTRALSREASSRFQSAGEMERALLECSGHPAPAPAPAPASEVRIPATRERPSPRRAILASLAVAAAAALSLFLVFGDFTGKPSDFRIERTALYSGERRLSENDAVRVGDLLSLRFRSDEPVHVYVLNEDEKGERHLLFPRPDGDLKNPLLPAREHRLPGPMAGEEKDWEVSSAGGRESIFIVASLEPLPELERLVAGPAAKTYPEVTPEALAEVRRGIGKVAPAETSKKGETVAALGTLIEELRDIQDTGESARGIWIRKVTLRNP